MALVDFGLVPLSHDTGGMLGGNIDRGSTGDAHVYPDDDIVFAQHLGRVVP